MKGKSGLIRCSAAALILSLFVLGSGVCVYGALSSSNIHDNNYVQWASPVYSNLYEDNGALVRVECAGGNVAVEKYDTDGNFLSTVTQFDAPHPIFGGFYQNEKYFYLAFGQNNSGNDDTLDVVFLRQYDKNWNFLRETAVKAIDTHSPFDAGSLRMAEAKGMLYVFTCHVMYSGHQANMTLIFDSEDISYIKRSTSPYSSHSFNQFIQTDGSYMYTLDHGDAYPRALMMGKYQAGVSSFYASTKELYNIVGTTGNNATGVSVGGFLLSGDKFYIAGNSIVQDEATYQTDTHRNIFLMTTDKNMSAPSTVWLTNYAKDDGITVKTPSITQLDDGNFIIMWEEYASSKYITKIAKVSPSGNILRSGQTLAPLSDCRALLCSDGKMRWYVTNSSAPIFYTFDPSTFDVPTTPAEDWNIDANGTLTVGGKGFLPDSPIPWEDQKANIKHVVIKNGVYNVPQNAFK
ncbi:MAG: hypothetical protein IJR59_02330, partial [Firmicutes bacterium]|nr:hypothetical protein [Bacillota bacterium]